MMRHTSKALRDSSRPALLDMSAAKIQGMWRGVMARGTTTRALAEKFVALNLTRERIIGMRYILYFSLYCAFE
jgi:hypothetical protein